MILKTVYFVRHGQTEANIAPIYQPPNAPLNHRGIEQAHRIAGRISKLSFNVLIASTYERARQTADIIKDATQTTVEYSPLFIERAKPTNVDGKPYSDPQASALWENWESSLYTPGMRIEDGENFDDLMERSKKALAHLEERPEQSIVVVTHGFFLRTIVAHVLLGDLLSGDALRHFQHAASMENTGITVLELTQEDAESPFWRLWTYNDHAHLGA
jgi:broad specificity phosphatase PhoE